MTTAAPEAPVLEAIKDKVKDSAWEAGQKPRLDTTFRCDHRECESQAYVEVTTVNGVLIFCGHHAKRLRPKMESRGAIVKWYSEEARLIENKTQGSEN